ncbi:hypothetical protein CSB45_09690 [candidate division KSB3 bacterium]|uniref:Uncharacterized protein n=1 Tax=candidate division KSB3 bacterium TaxID=2044937 RepID=A0A2G6E4B6_9BACT|nr:MAG: hypothetical protein CSB45_09690 [candidate division KSB3 bacterium]PIE29412.1 MAG: hypothetical protein CSA57_08385 [candidate division KSB3 bacterium]
MLSCPCDCADLSRGRWASETAFQDLTEHLPSEIKTFRSPPAALFGFCIALIACLIMKVIRAALSAVHGRELIATEVSDSYISLELSGNVSRDDDRDSGGGMNLVPDALPDGLYQRAETIGLKGESRHLSKAPTRPEKAHVKTKEGSKNASSLNGQTTERTKERISYL